MCQGVLTLKERIQQVLDLVAVTGKHQYDLVRKYECRRHPNGAPGACCLGIFRLDVPPAISTSMIGTGGPMKPWGNFA